MVDVGGMPTIPNGRGQAGNQTGLLIHALQKKSSEVAGHSAAIEVGTNSKPGDGRKAELAWDRITHGRSRLSFVRSVIGVTPIISTG